MSGLTRAGIALVFVALAAIGASWNYWLASMAEMDRELAEVKAMAAAANASLEAALAQCGAALAAADLVMRERERVHEQTRMRAARLDQALGDADLMHIPDSLRQWFGADDLSAHAPGPAAGQPAGADPAAAQD